MAKWKHTSYLQKGLSHAETNTPCQDSVVVIEDEHCIVAALADGLGSLKYSDVAASVATKTVCALFSSVGNRKILAKKQMLAEEIVQKVTENIQKEAASIGVATSQMDCTLVFVYISKKHNCAITGRLGDSAICIFTKDGSISINDGNSSANGTSAVLDRDAYASLEISFWDIDKNNIYGFLLTSDGLDNEIYRKGSKFVNKAAEDYFNSVALYPNPGSVIQEKIAKLTAAEDSQFDDDISIAVISRARTAIVLPSDPTWLCTCGERNRMQDTYCANCSADFSMLYQNLNFKEYGGKAAFFTEINKDPDKEREIIGLPIDPPSDPGHGSKEKVIEKKQKTRNNIQPLLIACMLCLIAGLILGSSLTKLSVSKRIRTLLEEKRELTAQIQHLSDKAQTEPVTTEPEETVEPTEIVETEPVIILPEDILVDDNSVYYWGEIKDDLPHGYGIFLKDEYYYSGLFHCGEKEGEFVITPKHEVTRNIVVFYDDGEIVPEKLSYDQYIVTTSVLNVHSQAGSDSTVIDELEENDTVYVTYSPVEQAEETEKTSWVEIICGDIIGWVPLDALELKQP